MNASTFTARVIASTGADVAACLSGAVGALSARLRGAVAREAHDRRCGALGQRSEEYVMASSTAVSG